jgi:hypothetical protein
MDDALRNRLWNVFYVTYLKSAWEMVLTGSDLPWKVDVAPLVTKLWHGHFAAPVDSIPPTAGGVIRDVRARFFGCPWWGVYDLLEAIVRFDEDGGRSSAFIDLCNRVLEQDKAGYRFLGRIVSPITSPAELAEVQHAIQSGDGLTAVSQHIARATELLSDRQQPDYRNSIKESISAVEAVCCLITGGKATLGEALKVLDKTLPIHGALKQAFERLYGYTSDAQGIRHALLDEPSLGLEDAHFMLVVCSAFVNYLKAKLAKVPAAPASE